LLGNIQLAYRLIVVRGNESFYCEGAEVFTDEHGVQWVKFFPNNGYHSGSEHIMRTDSVYIVRDNG
jgi:hypothetical protein